MDQSPNQLRIARMESECNISCVPALVLMAGCATLVLVLALCDPLPEMVAARGGAETEQLTPFAP